jgi:DNA mismatch repair ATPase MutS
VIDPIWRFSQIDFLHEAFAPRTPQGRRSKDRREVLVSRRALERQYDLTEAALGLLQSGGESPSRLAYHLKRIPLLPDPCGDGLEGPGVFGVKKFLVNYRAVLDLLDADARETFGLDFASEDLLAELNKGGENEEAFYLSDRYSSELRAIRVQIREKDETLARLKDDTLQRLHDRHGLDFRERDFLVVENQQAESLDREAVFFESHDDRHVIVKPVFGPEVFQIVARRDQLVREEHRIERRVLAGLSERIEVDRKKLDRYADAVERLDLALARAELCVRFRLTRPVLRAPGATIHMQSGRLPPLETRCGDEDETYWPLSATFETTVTVIHGSNMCGKTVALQTVAFAQLAAQLGFFVPAERFETVVFDRLYFVGANMKETPDGLSSFGREVAALAGALDTLGERTLLLVDEFGRATNSQEATALLAGLLGWLAGRPAVHAFLATHYAGLPDGAGVAHYRMKGLSREGLQNAIRAEPGSLAERMKVVHRHVRYDLVPDREKKPYHDALCIAEALGLHAEIIRSAEAYLADVGRGHCREEP